MTLSRWLWLTLAAALLVALAWGMNGVVDSELVFGGGGGLVMIVMLLIVVARKDPSDG